MSIEFKLPELGENIESGDVVNLLVREGEQIEGNQSVVELETDKAVIEVPCPHAGKVEKIHVGKGDTVKIGQPLLTIDAAAEPEPAPAAAAPAPEETPAAPAAPSQPAPAPTPTPTPAPPVDGPIPAGPAARRLARELGIDIGRVAGSGARGRITIEDVQAAGSGAAGISTAPAAPIGQPVTPPGTPGSDNWGSVRVEKMSKIRRTIAAQMVKSATTIPHVTNFDDADVTVLDEMRKSIPKGYLGADIKLTAMPFVMKAVAAALRQHPLLNASIDDENEQIVYREYVNLGIAVDTPRGLVVPAMRNVDRMTIAQIAAGLTDLAAKARNVSFAIEDLRGGTFTISNLGAVGGAYSTPIINHPEVAILLLGRSRWMPVAGNGSVETRLMMPLSLSYDHRIVDGATAARFLNQVIDYLQSPAKMLITG